MEVIKVLQKGQIVIPKDLRNQLKVKEGSRLLVERIDGSLLLVPEPARPLAAMKGLLKQAAEQPATRAVRRLRREWERQTR